MNQTSVPPEFRLIEDEKIEEEVTGATYEYLERESTTYCSECGTHFEFWMVPDGECEYCGRKLEVK